MCTYNADCLFLKEAIMSVLNQTYKNFELMIVNDGSTEEGTKELLTKLIELALEE